MDPSTIILSVAGPAITVGLAIWSDRRQRAREREAAQAQAVRDREQQLEQVKQLLQTMVVDRIEAAFGEIGKLQKARQRSDREFSELKGFLKGKGCVLPETCPDEDEGAVS